MDEDLREEYRRARKRARDRLYSARKAGVTGAYAEDLPPIPENPTREDIEELENIGREEIEEEYGDIWHTEEDEEDYRYGDDYADEDEAAEYDIIQEITDRLLELYNKIASTEFLGSNKGMVILGERGNRPVVYHDADTDKFEALNILNDMIDSYTQDATSAKEYYSHISYYQGYISELLGAIFEDYRLPVYQRHYAELCSILSYDVELTASQMRNISDDISITSAMNDFEDEDEFDLPDIDY